MRFFRFFCVTAALTLTLTLSACGGGGAHKLDDADLRDMVMITSEGLPWPVSLATDKAMSNEEAASQFPDPQQWLKNYDEWGRVGDHYAEFRSQGVTPPVGISVDAEYYSSATGAGSAWAAIRDLTLSDEMAQSLKDKGMTEAAISEVGAESVGDESAAIFMGTISGNVEGGTYVILFHRDGIVGSVTVSAVAGAISVEDAVAVAKELDARIQDVLNR
jgi:hypothetical protein